MLDTTATAIVLVKDWLGQPEIEEWDQRAEEDDGGIDGDLYKQLIGRPIVLNIEEVLVASVQ